MKPIDVLYRIERLQEEEATSEEILKEVECILLQVWQEGYESCQDRLRVIYGD